MKTKALLIFLCCLGSFRAAAVIIIEEFGSNPFSQGWRTFGDSSVFAWNSTNRNMEVTWDSSHSNGFFYLPLGTILTKNEDFAVTFDMQLKDLKLGTTRGKTNTFEIALGFLNTRTITNANYFRGAGQNSVYGVRNLAEFDYFADSGFGDTFASTVVSTNNRILPVHNFPLEMTPNDVFRISLNYTSSNKTLHASATKNGSPFGLSPSNSLGDMVLTTHPDFRVDAFGVSNYSDAIQTSTPDYWGSVLAHAQLDNVRLTIPAPPLQSFTFAISNAVPTLSFSSRTNWTYSLQRSLDTRNWQDLGSALAGTGLSMTLTDSNAPKPFAFYKIRMERP